MKLTRPVDRPQPGNRRASRSLFDSIPAQTIECRSTAAAIEEATAGAQPDDSRAWSSSLVPLSGKNRALNELTITRGDEPVANNLVMLHGYGAGLGFFYRNFEALSRVNGWRIYALDLLGMGRSSRPPFRIGARGREERIKEAEDWFVDALEEWRHKRGMDKMTLLGHSMGGYLAVCYALKYPGHLNKLILVSPVGVPEDPHAVSEALPDPDQSTMMNEFEQDQGETTASNQGQKSRTPQSQPLANGPPRRRFPRWFTYLWESNMLSPFSLVRWTGPLAPRLVSTWTSRRFSHLPEAEAQALHDYTYSIFRQPGSSEYALSYILAPGAFARSPLVRRIAALGRGSVSPAEVPTTDFTHARDPPPPSGSASSSVSAVGSDAGAPPPSSQPTPETPYPIVFVYGENDWMDAAGGRACEKKILEARERALQGKSSAERERDKGVAKTIVIKRAGHHVYLDGWDDFNRAMVEEMESVGK